MDGSDSGTPNPLNPMSGGMPEMPKARPTSAMPEFKEAKPVTRPANHGVIDPMMRSVPHGLSDILALLWRLSWDRQNITIRLPCRSFSRINVMR